MAKKNQDRNRRAQARAQRRQRRVRAKNNPSVREVVFHEDGSRTLHLTTEASEEMREYMAWAEQEFLRVWGRPMGPNDPVFPDWDAPVPAPLSAAKMEAQLVAMMEAAGLEGRFIYAFQQSGVMLTESNEDLVDPEAREEWLAALDRFDAAHAS
jgi:hypothetical protein